MSLQSSVMASHFSEMSPTAGEFFISKSHFLSLCSPECPCGHRGAALPSTFRALQRVGLSAVAGRTNHLWVGWRGVCYTTRVLLTIVSSVGGKSVCGVGMCVFGEGGQGQGQAVGLYLELNAKQFYVLCGYQCCNGKLNMWTRIIIGIIKHPKTK